MTVNVNTPQTLLPLLAMIKDPHLASYLRELQFVLYQLWNRSGGSTDFIATNQGDLVSYSSSLNAHTALVEEHIDWTVDQGATDIDIGNYRDWTVDLSPLAINDANYKTDHTEFTSIGTNTHAQIDTHLANSNIHLISSTTSALEDQTDSINTSSDKVLGYAVFNTTTKVVVFASGNADNSVWHYYNGATAHTPV